MAPAPALALSAGCHRPRHRGRGTRSPGPWHSCLGAPARDVGRELAVTGGRLTAGRGGRAVDGELPRHKDEVRLHVQQTHGLTGRADVQPRLYAGLLKENVWAVRLPSDELGAVMALPASGRTGQPSRTPFLEV